MAPVEVAALDDLQHGATNVHTVGGRELVLVRWNDDVYALRNICPHMSTALDRNAMVVAYRGGSTPGEVTIERDNPVIACPWHGYEYTLRDGLCITDAGLRVRSYPVEIKDGKVLVDLAGHRTPRAPVQVQV